jgi:hypothetical protein
MYSLTHAVAMEIIEDRHRQAADYHRQHAGAPARRGLRWPSLPWRSRHRTGADVTPLPEPAPASTRQAA